MDSKIMLKTQIEKDCYFHNQAGLGETPDWIILKKHGGYMLTQKQYDKLIRGEERHDKS